jgi:hypothetical protein
VTEILSKTLYKIVVFSKEREKASNRKANAEQSQKRPEAAQKNQAVSRGKTEEGREN